jgi:hypothetical protein
LHPPRVVYRVHEGGGLDLAVLNMPLVQHPFFA